MPLIRLTEEALRTLSFRYRYPGDWPELTDDDASNALSVARSVCDSVGAEFGRRGVL